MTNTSPNDVQVLELLDRYEAAGHGDDFSGLRDLFAPSFLAGGPDGAATVTVDMVVAAATSRRRRLGPLGLGDGRRTSTRLTWLGRGYCLAVTGWELDLTPPGRRPTTVSADSDFLVHLGPSGARIVAYLARQDIEASVATVLAG